MEGLAVTFKLVPSAKGTQAQDIGVGSLPIERDSDWLARAILARDARRYDEAARFYEMGLRSGPSVQLISSYAAMEKNRNRKQPAMRVYEAGIGRFPENAKLREDAGILAASLGDTKLAVRLLKESLALCRATDQGGEKGVLLALARTHYQIGTLAALRECTKHYENALLLFGKGRTQLPEADVLRLKLAAIRLQHHRGNACVEFLRRAGFEVIRASLLEQATEGAEFIVEVNNPELRETYGLASQLLIRCMFKGQVLVSDLNRLDASVKKWATSGLGDEQVAFMVVSSLAEDLQRLAQRIEEKGSDLPAIVPLQQSEIETSGEALAPVRAALDRWLYRRDLFAGSSPVEGKRFFGRDKPLAQLREAITSATPTGIFGLRKVGKTSLLKEARRRATERGDVVVYIDLLRVPSDVSDCTWLYWKIGDELNRAVQRLPLPPMKWRLGGVFTDFLDISAGFPVSTAFDADITRLLTLLRDCDIFPRPRVVVLLDEVERLLPTSLGKSGFSGFFDFFSYLRGVSQEHSDFLPIITGANAMVSEVAQFERRDNPFSTFLKKSTYHPLSRENAQR